MATYSLFPSSFTSSVPIRIIPPDTSLENLVQSELEYTDSENSRFYLADLGTLREQYAQWVAELPRIQPYYAIKCNPNLQFCKLLANLGCNFDCASLKEIETVLSLGVSADRIIFANPCKFPLHIRRAREYGVDIMTADNIDEIAKISKINPKAQIVLRIATDDRNALCKFSSKFGARESSWEALLLACQKWKLEMIGVSFHVGSGSSDLEVYPATLKATRQLFDLAIKHGFTPRLVDIGGGFPGQPEWKPTFPEIAKGIREAIDTLFPNKEIKFIAEPGRYFAERTQILVARIIARRFSEEDVAKGNNVLYYIDEGTYQSFNCIVNDHYIPKYLFFSKNGTRDAEWLAEVNSRKKYLSTVFGPTCDSIDTIYRDVELPLYNIGEWMVFPNMGAYTSSPSVAFNGLICDDYRYIDTNPYCVVGKEPNTATTTTSTISVTVATAKKTSANRALEKNSFQFDDEAYRGKILTDIEDIGTVASEFENFASETENL